MTATLITAGEVFDDDRSAGFRLSNRQHDVLRTLNTLFDELSPAPIPDEDLIDLREFQFEACDVSRVVRD